MFFTKGGAVVSGVEAKLPGVLSMLIVFENLQPWGIQKILRFGSFVKLSSWHMFSESSPFFQS